MRYTLTMGGTNQLSKSVPVAQDGSFSVAVRIPQDVKAGTAEIWLHGSPWDICNDTPGKNSCVGYRTPPIAVVRG